jgi:hypothetical protein
MFYSAYVHSMNVLFNQINTRDTHARSKCKTSEKTFRTQKTKSLILKMLILKFPNQNISFYSDIDKKE